MWESEQVHLPYHLSIRHLAFQVDLEDMKQVQEWIKEKRGIKVRKSFGIEPDQQPLILENSLNTHAAIYFNDPDGNSIELIAPLVVEGKLTFNEQKGPQWLEKRREEQEGELGSLV